MHSSLRGDEIFLSCKREDLIAHLLSSVYAEIKCLIPKFLNGSHLTKMQRAIVMIWRADAQNIMMDLSNRSE